MTTSDFSDPNLTPHAETALPRIKLRTMFRLGLFQMGLGILTVLTVGVLNRVMIAELAIPAGITSVVLAMSLLVAPVRVWFGQLSDAKPLLGQHRTPYVWLGAALFTLILSLAVQVVWQLGDAVQLLDGWAWTAQTTGWTALLALLFALYGFALSSSSTPFFALLVDISDEDNRGQLIGIVWTMMTVGLAVGGISSKILLTPLDDINASVAAVQASINTLFLLVPLIILVLAFLATWGVEKKYSRYASRSSLVERADQITLSRALKILTSNRQTGIFFSFLLLMTLSLFLQEAVLEPYGGEVFQMTIPETSLLNTYWATGMLVSLSATGFLIIPRLGKRKTTRLGCISVAFCFILIILAGFTGNVRVLQLALLLFGLFTGVLTTGALSLMLDLTAAETAGTFVGAWGLSQALARGIAVASGGVILSMGQALFDAPMLSYGLVFGLQALGLLLATVLLNRVNVQEFRTSAKTAIATMMENDLD